MYDQRFFSSKLGFSALISIAAMLAFNLYAFGHSHADISRADTSVIALAPAVLA